MEEEKVTKKLKTEIERRTRDTSRLIEIETQKLAVGEMVLERLDTILDLLHAAGFKAIKVTTAKPVQQPVPTTPSLPPNTVVVQATQLAPQEAAPVKNPCSVCGQEAAFDEPMQDGSKKFYCRPHGQQRMKEKAEEASTAAIFHGNTGTMFTRPKNPNAPAPQKIIIQADPDPLKGPFPNGGAPPPNPVLDE